MAVFPLHRKHQPTSQEAIRVIAIEAPARPRVVGHDQRRANRARQLRGEAAPAAGASLTAAFLIASAIIVSALVLWP